jgi:hypothetical protein
MKSLLKYLKNKLKKRIPLLLNAEKLCLLEIKGYVYCVDIFMISKLLQQYMEPSYIEFGVYAGRSFFNVLINTQKYLNSYPEKNKPALTAIAVDHFPGQPKIKKEFLKNTKLLQTTYLKNCNIKYEKYSVNLNKNIRGSVFHIDSCHSESEFTKDFLCAYKHLEEDGVIVCDDVWSDIFPGVTSGCFKMIHQLKLSAFLATSAKLYICRPKFHAKNLNRIKSCLDQIRCPYFFNFASDSYLQTNSIRGYPVLSLKTYIKEKVINYEEYFDQIFKKNRLH